MTMKRMTKKTATKELVNNVCGKAINEADESTAPLDKIMKKVEDKNPSGDPEFPSPTSLGFTLDRPPSRGAGSNAGAGF